MTYTVLMRRNTILVFALLYGVDRSNDVLAQPLAAPPKGARALFNGKNLDGWYVYTQQLKYENPGLFSVVDGQIRVQGGKGDTAYYGGLITKEEFSDYHLIVEYRWGKPTYGNRKDKARDSGILLHCVGPDGPGPWKTSIECQIIEGGTGDIILIAGPDAEGKPFQPTITARAVRRDGQFIYDPQGAELTLSQGRLNWYGRDPAWRDVVGFRGRDDVESPGEEWTRVECLCRGNRIDLYVNGKLVNQALTSNCRKGKILLQTEGAELWFRKVELIPLDPSGG